MVETLENTRDYRLANYLAAANQASVFLPDAYASACSHALQDLTKAPPSMAMISLDRAKEQAMGVVGELRLECLKNPSWNHVLAGVGDLPKVERGAEHGRSPV